MDTERPDEYDGTAGATPAADGADGAGSATTDATGVAYADAVDPAPVAAPKTRLLLGALAGLGVALLGIVAWVVLYLTTDRDFPGITVVTALLIGYVVREVSRRSDVPARLVSALLAAVMCLVGAVAAISALVVKDTPVGEAAGFVETFRGLMPHVFDVVNDRYQPRPWLTWLIFGAAVLVAYFSTAPAKPKKGAATAAPAEPAAPMSDD